MEQQENISDLKDGIKELLGNLVKRIKSICDLYYIDDKEKANKRIIFLVEDFGPLIEAMYIIKQEESKEQIQEFQMYMNQIVTSFESQDYTSISDLLQFEVVPLLEDWEDQINNE